VSWGGTPAEAWTALDYCDEKDLVLGTSATLDEMPWGPEEPGLIYNAMIAPLIQYYIAGTIWYQGETHAENLSYNPAMYSKVFPVLINSWRNAWGYPFPFYFVQIAPFRGYAGDRGVIIRDAQRRSLMVDNTAMVVTSDIGDIHNLHPGNKKEVGLRLAQIALNRTYGDNSAIDSGPLYRSHEVMADKIRIQFDFAEGLNYTGKELTGFEIAGKDNIFYPASAEIEEETVIIHSSKVPEPVHARFAWSKDATPQLFNTAKLPTSSFTTIALD
jgi:sialate O-acetylesterase